MREIDNWIWADVFRRKHSPKAAQHACPSDSFSLIPF